MPTKTANRREFLQLANKYKPDKSKVGGWYLSEKLDGTRCFWDGGITRGMATAEVPWASVTDPKTGKRKAKIKPVATGLWSRYGNPIIAPDDFLNLLPCVPLDGELWAGRGNFQLCRSICAGDSPDPRFSQIEFAVYGTPSFASVFRSGEIKNTNMVCTVDYASILKWVDARRKRLGMDLFTLGSDATFEHEMVCLRENLDIDRVFMHKQIKLPADHEEAAICVEQELSRVLDLGAEGIVLRDPTTSWTPKRHIGLLKYKPFDDDEGMIVGFTSGRETDKGSKHLGKIGALILNYDGKRLELSGLTDAEREFQFPSDADYARQHPGEDMPKSMQGKHFRTGERVTFLYRELSDDGIPKEARYFRPRDEE